MSSKIKHIFFLIKEPLKNLFELTAYMIPVLVFMIILIVVIGFFYAG